MKTKLKYIMVLGIMTIAMVTAGVPLGKRSQSQTKTPCYSDLEVKLLMEANHYQHDQAVQLLNLSCEYAITSK
jgi:hypothetical protein